MASIDWTKLPAEHNLSKFAADLPKILQQTEHHEMYGVVLEAPSEGKAASHTTLIILQKFLRANANDLGKAKEQLSAALTWRKVYNPMAAKDEVFDASKFGGLGYVTTLKGAKETQNASDVATFNIYGTAAKDPKKTFGDTDAFIRWRVALMELTLSQLHLDQADRTIPDYGQGPDPYQAIQIHDYLSVSFFRQPAEIKASSSKIISMFQQYYPETVSYKYFVNVPLVMQWMMGAMKAIMSKDSIQKMTWLTYGNQLAQYVGTDVPKEYGGTGATLEGRGATPKYDVPADEKKGSTQQYGGVETSTESPTVPPAQDGTSDASKEPAAEAAKAGETGA